MSLFTLIIFSIILTIALFIAMLPYIIAPSLKSIISAKLRGKKLLINVDTQTQTVKIKPVTIKDGLIFVDKDTKITITSEPYRLDGVTAFFTVDNNAQTASFKSTIYVYEDEATQQAKVLTKRPVVHLTTTDVEALIRFIKAWVVSEMMQTMKKKTGIISTSNIPFGAIMFIVIIIVIAVAALKFI